MRYVMWIADSANHQILERKWRFWVFPGARLSEYH